MMTQLFFLSVSGSLTLLAIWLADRDAGRFIRTRWRRLWWLLLPLAFLVPIRLPVPFPDWAPQMLIREWTGQNRTVLETAGSPSSSLPSLSSGPSADAGGFPWFLAFWAVGAFAFLAIVMVRTFRACYRFKRLRLCTDNRLLSLLEDCKAIADVTQPVGLVVTDEVSTPALLGWLRPRILLPTALAHEGTSGRLRAVFYHELAHLRYHDILANWLFTLLRAIHWFNPFAHHAARCWEGFCEEAADEAAITWMEDPTGQAYGSALLKVLQSTRHSNAPYGTLGIGETSENLKRRMLMIRHYPQKRPFALFATALAAFFLTLLVIEPARAQTDDPEAAKKAAVAGMEIWLHGIDEANYPGSWKAASKMFQGAVTSDQWISALKGVRTPLGACSERRLVSAMVQKEIPQLGKEALKGHFVIAQFDSSFANMKYAMETVTFEQEADGAWRASGYYIKPRP